MGTFAIIALIISAVLGAGNGLANFFSTRSTNKQNEKQYEDWKEYNTPANQMQRLDDAGLNPYLVSNVGNTLSEPFKIGSNNGISEMLNGLSQSSATAAQFAQNDYEQNLNRELTEKSLELKKQQLELNSIGMQIREKLARSAMRVGDARVALLWSQGRGQDILNMYNRSAMPYRLTGLYLGNALKSQELEHNANIFPMMEQYYEPVQRAKINSIYRSMSHYDFMEAFMKEKFMQEMALAWDKHIFNQDYSWRRFYQAENFFNMRYGLSRDYFNLAKRKFRWSNFWRGYDTFRHERDGALKLLNFGLGKSPNSYGILSPNLKF